MAVARCLRPRELRADGDAADLAPDEALDHLVAIASAAQCAIDGKQHRGDLFVIEEIRRKALPGLGERDTEIVACLDQRRAESLALSGISGIEHRLDDR